MQWEIISSALNGHDLLVVMSTGIFFFNYILFYYFFYLGYGKSICYQMPSLINNNLTIVISPLISLMEDQVRTLL